MEAQLFLEVLVGLELELAPDIVRLEDLFEGREGDGKDQAFSEVSALVEKEVSWLLQDASVRIDEPCFEHEGRVPRGPLKDGVWDPGRDRP